ncbi:hypothetical protein Hokovirus_3_205 [Hokovirus HKV1]|uniref:Uncharacterized protein n=1 Tax=Hokovirus HKV1 TaxID=1977638 RepID=A0A1V0SGT7_9VIRU|nr:hypothetical protein Hokovirus_3_205 [Hokovirus HKV1]
MIELQQNCHLDNDYPMDLLSFFDKYEPIDTLSEALEQATTLKQIYDNNKENDYDMELNNYDKYDFNKICHNGNKILSTRIQRFNHELLKLYFDYKNNKKETIKNILIKIRMVSDIILCHERQTCNNKNCIIMGLIDCIIDNIKHHFYTWPNTNEINVIIKQAQYFKKLSDYGLGRETYGQIYSEVKLRKNIAGKDWGKDIKKFVRKNIVQTRISLFNEERYKLYLLCTENKNIFNHTELTKILLRIFDATKYIIQYENITTIV